LNDHILQAIDEELERLHKVREILTDTSQTPARNKAKPALASQGKPRRKMSAKARRAIAEAQRKRWAKVKSQKKAATPAVPDKKESAAS
jgi:hypothetical protein